MSLFSKIHSLKSEHYSFLFREYVIYVAALCTPCVYPPQGTVNSRTVYLSYLSKLPL